MRIVNSCLTLLFLIYIFLYFSILAIASYFLHFITSLLPNIDPNFLTLFSNFVLLLPISMFVCSLFICSDVFSFSSSFSIPKFHSFTISPQIYYTGLFLLLVYFYFLFLNHIFHIYSSLLLLIVF